jgi:hypothetical protein
VEGVVTVPQCNQPAPTGKNALIASYIAWAGRSIEYRDRFFAPGPASVQRTRIAARRMSAPPNRERISASAASDILGLPVRTVQQLAARGDIPGAAKFGRSWTFDQEKLRRLIREKERGQWQSEKRRPDVFGVAKLYGGASVTAVGTSAGRFTRVTRRLRGNGARRGR